eukprot:CAMPEP_0202340684 /NCGR_PEP_ID=MMETSP1126-20121109/2015_1 /ASSEMBLY_ACC=CAM_ASM_000457 /TAXON_ID=3047 /ORGANISM="Dunaliella tertiolecta, Strain CCMP1320" /LENGTH=72 /DNA_ID=CAMNT_0048931419 /DNA_START=1669 /DNA_END=1887 /DNA_ORIENTATION=+
MVPVLRVPKEELGRRVPGLRSDRVSNVTGSSSGSSGSAYPQYFAVDLPIKVVIAVLVASVCERTERSDKASG